MEKKKIPVALMIAAGMLLYNNTVAAQSLPPTQETSQHQLSFNEALQLLHKGNQSLKIADKGIDIARAERGKLNAFWMPSLQSTGAFVHLSEKIEVKQPLSQFTDPAKDFVHSILPDDKIISSILDQIGTNTLIFPLAPRNLTTVDLTAEWDKVSETGSLVQGCVVVRKAFADEHPNEVKAFLDEYKASIEFLTAEPEQAGQMIQDAGIFAKAAVAAKAIPNCNVCFVSGAEMQAPLTAFLTALSTVAPQSIGGSVPGDDFYCVLK